MRRKHGQGTSCGCHSPGTRGAPARTRKVRGVAGQGGQLALPLGRPALSRHAVAGQLRLKARPDGGARRRVRHCLEDGAAAQVRGRQAGRRRVSTSLLAGSTRGRAPHERTDGPTDGCSPQPGTGGRGSSRRAGMYRRRLSRSCTPHTPREQAWERQLPSPSVCSTSWCVHPGTPLITPSCKGRRGERGGSRALSSAGSASDSTGARCQQCASSSGQPCSSHLLRLPLQV